MAIVDLYNMKGQKIGEQELSDEIFSIEPNLDVMWRYIDYQLSRRRAGTASTKTRAEVSGGGRKPWPQKHTGRARHGSIRSPSGDTVALHMVPSRRIGARNCRKR